MSGSGAMAVVGLIVLAAALVLAALGWLVWRLDAHCDEITGKMLHLTADVHGQLRVLSRASETLANQAQDVARKSEAVPAQPPAPAVLGAGALKQITSAIAALLPKAGKSASEGAKEKEAAISNESAAEINRLHTQKGRLEGELETLREQMHGSRRQLSEQRREIQAAMAALSNSTALRSANEQLMNELKDTRVRNNALESRIEPVMTELKIVREQLAALLGSTGSEGTDFAAAIAAATDNIAAVHLERVAELERELGKANTEALKVREELSRTLREKSFIEEEYLQMTEANEADEAVQA